MGQTNYLNNFISEFYNTCRLDAECFKYLLVCWKKSFKFHISLNVNSHSYVSHICSYDTTIPSECRE